MRGQRYVASRTGAATTFQTLWVAAPPDRAGRRWRRRRQQRDAAGHAGVRILTKYGNPVLSWTNARAAWLMTLALITVSACQVVGVCRPMKRLGGALLTEGVQADIPASPKNEDAMLEAARTRLGEH